MIRNQQTKVQGQKNGPRPILKDFTHLKRCKKKKIQEDGTEILWPAKPKIFTIWPCAESFPKPAWMHKAWFGVGQRTC